MATVRIPEAIDRLDSPDERARDEARAFLVGELDLEGDVIPALAKGVGWGATLTYDRSIRLAAFLASIASPGDVSFLLETAAHHGGATRDFVYRTLRLWIDSAPDGTVVSGAAICVLTAAESSDSALTDLVCDALLARAKLRPHPELRAILPLLEDATKHRRVVRPRATFRRAKTGPASDRWRETADALDELVPPSALPIPSHGTMDRAKSLPRPAEPEAVAPADLPKPSANAPMPNKKPWWRR